MMDHTVQTKQLDVCETVVDKLSGFGNNLTDRIAGVFQQATSNS